jgi:hypothetical protein
MVARDCVLEVHVVHDTLLELLYLCHALPHNPFDGLGKKKVQINFFSRSPKNERRSNKSSRLPDGPGSQKEAGFLDSHELESAQRRAAPQPVPCVSAEAFCALP